MAHTVEDEVVTFLRIRHEIFHRLDLPSSGINAPHL